MSQQAIAIFNLSVVASGAITQYRAVGFTGAQATVAGQKVLGIANRTAASGQAVDVSVLGTATAETGAGAITVGAALSVDTSGRVVAAAALTVAAGATPVTSTGANGAILVGAEPPAYIVGYALEASSGAGNFIEILLK